MVYVHSTTWFTCYAEEWCDGNSCCHVLGSFGVHSRIIRKKRNVVIVLRWPAFPRIVREGLGEVESDVTAHACNSDVREASFTIHTPLTNSQIIPAVWSNASASHDAVRLDEIVHIGSRVLTWREELVVPADGHVNIKGRMTANSDRNIRSAVIRIFCQCLNSEREWLIDKQSDGSR